VDERKQFTFYESFYSALKRIRKKQDRADAYELICEYALFHKEPDLDSVPDSVAIAFELLRPVLDSARKKAESGKQGGSKPKAKGKQKGSKLKQPKTEGEKEKEREIEVEIELENEIESELDSLQPRSDGSLFTSFWNAYPEHARGEREAAWEAWKALNPTEEKATQIMEYLGYWKESQRWVSDDGAFIPAAKNFLTPEKSYLRTKPVPAKQGNSWTNNGERIPDKWEIEAIRRIMNENFDDLPPLEEE
jgi:hypothetical protein